MGKLAEFFKHFKNKYDEEQKRLMRMDRFLDKAEENNDKLKDMSTDMKLVTGKITEIETKVDQLQDNVNQINGRLEIIGAGTKMELFDTLYHWKKILVDRGWKTEAEMREIEEVYRIYHDGLGGNGQGEQYYNIIRDLPEKDLMP